MIWFTYPAETALLTVAIHWSVLACRCIEHAVIGNDRLDPVGPYQYQGSSNMPPVSSISDVENHSVIQNLIRTPAWPVVRKTLEQQHLEWAFALDRNNQPDIRDLLITAVRIKPNDRIAADCLGLRPSTLSHWISRLGIEPQCKAARQAREQAA